jgi:hypothetical protein
MLKYNIVCSKLSDDSLSPFFSPPSISFTDATVHDEPYPFYDSCPMVTVRDFRVQFLMIIVFEIFNWIQPPDSR